MNRQDFLENDAPPVALIYDYADDGKPISFLGTYSGEIVIHWLCHWLT